MGEEMFGVVSGKVELRYGNEVVATVDPSGTFGSGDRLGRAGSLTASPWNRRVSP